MKNSTIRNLIGLVIGVEAAFIGIAASSSIPLPQFEVAATRETSTVSETPLWSTPESFAPDDDASRLPFFRSVGKNGWSGWLIPREFKGMSEVWTILLTKDYDDPTWTAMVLTTRPDNTPNDDDNFISTQIPTVDDQISFSTNEIRGIRYEFDGSFVKLGNEFSEGEMVLRGTMVKIVKDEEVARFISDFAYFEPQCFH